MKDRFNMEVTKADYDALAKSLYDCQAHEEAVRQIPVSHCRKIRQPTTPCDGMLKEGLDVNYAATTFADENPVDVRFQDGKVRLALRLKSTTQPKLDGQGHRIINPYPAEIYVTYQLSQSGGQVTATRVEGEYGVKALPMPAGAESKLILDGTTPPQHHPHQDAAAAFLGAKGEAAEPDEEAAEPIFPASKSSTGLTLRGRWKKLGEMPWAQLTSQDGWLALGWKLTGNRTADSAQSEPVASQHPLLLPSSAVVT